VKLDVSYGAKKEDVSKFVYVPKVNGQTIDYQPYDPINGLPVGEVAILFLSRDLNGGGVADCPRSPAEAIQAGVKDTGLGTAFHITTDYPVVAYQITPYGAGVNGLGSATLLLPTSAWDTNYIAINAWKADVPTGALPSMSILAHKDGTQVTI